jgi:biopolymer transport protein ExbD
VIREQKQPEGSDMSAWFVRQEGSPEAVSVPDAVTVAEGLRDGNWLPTDEVRGPGDGEWRTIESHPTFAEAAEEVEPPKPVADEMQLDMNPLIDVCLVLLIFFILTITYASLERAIDIPPGSPEKQGPAKKHITEIKDQVFVLTAQLVNEGGTEKLELRLNKNPVTMENLAAEMKKIIETTGRRQMVLYVDKQISWGVFTAILDAAKGNGVTNIIRTSTLGAKK